MPERFFGKEIEVETVGEPRMPVSFTMEGREFRVAEVAEIWHDWGYGSSETSRTWRTRHHRTYYRVKTADGEVYEIYFDRGTNLRHPEYRKWFLTRKL